MGLKPVSAYLVSRSSAALMRESGSCAPSMAFSASTSPCDLGIGCLGAFCAQRVAAPRVNANSPPVIIRFMSKTPSVLLLLVASLDAFLGRLAGHLRRAFHLEGILVMPHGLLAFTRG